MMDIEELVSECMNACCRVRKVLYRGYLERVYQNALAHELRKSGFKVETEKDISVYYDGVEVGRTELIC